MLNSGLIRRAVLGVVAGLGLAGSAAQGAVYLYYGERASASVNANPSATQHYTLYNVPNLPDTVWGMPVTAPVEASWSGGASIGGSAESEFENLKAGFGASASASAEAFVKHGVLKASASAAASVSPGVQILTRDNGDPVSFHAPLTAGATGQIQAAYDDYITVSNPSLGSEDYVTLRGTLHLHAGIVIEASPFAAALAETGLQFNGAFAKLEPNGPYGNGGFTLTRRYENGAWQENDLDDVDFTISVKNGTSFGIYHTLQVKATAGAAYIADSGLTDVNAMNTSTLALTAGEAGTVFTSSSGSLYVVPEPAGVGAVGLVAAAMMRRKRVAGK